MSPNESEILNQYLLTSASLPSFLSLSDFTALFPKSQQSSPHIRSLYRDLQGQRNTIINSVQKNIEDEVREGKKRKRMIARERRQAEEDDIDDEVEIERALFGAVPNDGKHTLQTVVLELESAAEDIEAEIKELEAEEARLMESVKQIVGGLSDLRYGRLSNSQLKSEILEGLKNVEKTCHAKT